MRGHRLSKKVRMAFETSGGRGRGATNSKSSPNSQKLPRRSSRGLSSMAVEASASGSTSSSGKFESPLQGADLILADLAFGLYLRDGKVKPHIFGAQAEPEVDGRANHPADRKAVVLKARSSMYHGDVPEASSTELSSLMCHDDRSDTVLVEGSLRAVVLCWKDLFPKMAAISSRSIPAGTGREDVVQISALWAFFPATVLPEISSNSRSAHL